MRSIITIMMVLFSGSFLFAQVKFEKGYIFKNNGERLDVYIRNSSGMQREGEILYKLSENGETQNASPLDIKEFGIGENIKYLSKRVKVDNSARRNGKNLDKNEDLSLVERDVFLQVLVEGAASLYFYGGNNQQFYFSSATDNIEPLIFKEYLKEGGKIAENRSYRKQLFNSLKCRENSSLELQRIGYNFSDLIRFFEDFNECAGAEFQNYFQRDNKINVNLSIRPGINFTSLQLFFGGQVSGSREFSKVSNNQLRLGVEAEFVLPFNRNKWAYFIEPSFQKFSYAEERYDQEVIVDLSSIEIPIGARHYLFLNDDAKIFINAAFVPVLNINSEVYLQYYDDIGLSNKLYFIGGAGFKYRDKYSVEFRVGSKRDIIEDTETRWFSKYHSFSFIIGYSFF